MAEITAALVKDLRERTGVGMMDCKKALVEAKGDDASSRFAFTLRVTMTQPGAPETEDDPPFADAGGTR